MTLLELRDIEAHVDGVHVLRGVSLELAEGEFLALVGPRRGGKSTLLGALGGTVPVTGELRIEGETVGRPSPATMARLGVAHVPAGRVTFGSFTVADNLRLGAWARGGPLDNAYARVFELFPFLYDRRNRRSAELDAGEQRLLALARAAMARPRLLLCDEPSHGVAPAVGRDYFAALRQLNEWGATVVVAEQGGRPAPAEAGRALVVADGRVQAAPAPAP